MNTKASRHVLASKWKQARGTASHWWGKLTGNDPNRIEGRFEILVGVVEERYGHTRGRAQKKRGDS